MSAQAVRAYEYRTPRAGRGNVNITPAVTDIGLWRLLVAPERDYSLQQPVGRGGGDWLCVTALEKWYTATAPGLLDPISQTYLKLSCKLNSAVQNKPLIEFDTTSKTFFF